MHERWSQSTEYHTWMNRAHVINGIKLDYIEMILDFICTE